MEHGFSGRFSGTYPEAMERLKGSLVLPVTMSKQTFVSHFFKAIFDTAVSAFHGRFLA